MSNVQYSFVFMMLASLAFGGASFVFDYKSNRWLCGLLLVAAFATFIAFTYVNKPTGQAANNFGDLWLLQPLICFALALFAYGVACFSVAFGRLFTEKK